MNPDLVLASLVNGVMLGGLYALIALGLTLIFGVMKIINFAHGSLMMLAMYATFWLASTFGVDPYLSLIVTAPAGFLVGYAVQRGVVSPVLDAPEHNQLTGTGWAPRSGSSSRSGPTRRGSSSSPTSAASTT